LNWKLNSFFFLSSHIDHPDISVNQLISSLIKQAFYRVFYISFVFIFYVFERVINVKYNKLIVIKMDGFSKLFDFNLTFAK